MNFFGTEQMTQDDQGALTLTRARVCAHQKNSKADLIGQGFSKTLAHTKYLFYKPWTMIDVIDNFLEGVSQ